MCGICGIIGPRDDALEDTRLSGMLRALTPRGPDEEGVIRSGSARLGVRRLRVIDLATGSQPMSTPGGLLTALLNGEIYNFRELRRELEGAGRVFRSRSDTEVVLQGYERWGDGVFEKLDGMFAIALWNASREELVLARDRAGEKPLYWSLSNGRFVFASELRSLREGLTGEIRPSRPALARYLFFGYSPSPESVLNGVQKLRPAEVVTYRNGSVSTRRFWSHPDAASFADRAKSGDASLLESVTEAVRSRLVSDVPLGAFLSGGIDSTLVVDRLCALEAGPRTFSVGFSDPSYDESAKARAVARQLGTGHRERHFSDDSLVALLPDLGKIIDEPLADASILPTYVLCRFAREEVTVALSGDGGDDLFGGYPTYCAHLWADRLGALRGPVRAAASALERLLPRSDANLSLDFRLGKLALGLVDGAAWRHALWMSHCSPQLIAELMPDIPPGDLGDLLFEPVEARLGNRRFPGSLDVAMHLDLTLYLAEAVLMKVDRASMACSLEVRSPLLASRLIDAAAAIPAREKVGLFSTKRPLRRLLAGRFPSRIVRQPKKGFGIPVSRWLRTILREQVESTLRDAPFEPAAVGRLLAEHQSRRRNHRMALWALFIYGDWHRRLLAKPAKIREPSTGATGDLPSLNS